MTSFIIPKTEGKIPIAESTPILNQKTVPLQTGEVSIKNGRKNQKDISELIKNTVDVLQDENVRRRELALRQHAFFQLRLHLRYGTNLTAMDRSGNVEPFL